MYRLPSPNDLRRYAAQVVRGDIFAPTLFLPNGQRRTAALPVNKLILHSNTTDALRRAAAQVVRGMHLCVNHFFKWTTTHSARTIQKAFFAPPAISPNGQRRIAALPVIKFPLRLNTTEALRRCAA
ncbi:MAG: hypothetical protein DBY40_03685 [Clostridiales bacterium]|nr:MAG: hypothetical protein DBY40_03685 [Clostridiales bacterium]